MNSSNKMELMRGHNGGKCFNMFVLFFLVYETTCRHIFQLRAKCGVSLCAKRWTHHSKHKYLKGTNRSDAENDIHENDSVDVSSFSRKS